MFFCIFVPDMEYTLNCNGHLLDLSTPQVMGILNVTPDSFYADSRVQSERAVIARAHQILEEGGTIIDVGGCSTRPDSEPASQQEEMERLRFALTVICREVPDAIVSVDTFRSEVARMVVEEYGASIINDVSEGADERMFRMVARLHVPYVLMSVEPTMREMLLRFAREVDTLRSFGQKDIILDPGFGFGKTLEQNYAANVGTACIGWFFAEINDSSVIGHSACPGTQWHYGAQHRCLAERSLHPAGS